MLKSLPKIVIVLLAFIAIFTIKWFTPFHSDDYRYYLLGLSPAAHFHHYMSWSGRFVADYISSLILSTQSQFIYSVAAGLSTIAFCYFIVKTPSGTLRWSKHDFILFPLVFFTYWISNPNLGQTTFWTVGAANYLWTNLFVAAWLFHIYNITAKNIKKTNPLIVLLSFMAGCSTESVSPFVSLLSILAIIFKIWREKSVSLNMIIYSISTILGSCILILSPGNFVRASSEGAWYARPIFERISFHITERVHTHLALILICYTILFLLVMLVIFNKQIRVKIDRGNLVYARLVICVGLGTSLIMFASPTYPPRVMNGTFMFFLFAISFLAHGLLTSGVRTGVIGTVVVTILCGITFTKSYNLMYHTYEKIDGQERVRQRVINHEIATGKQIFDIPNYYFVKLQNSGAQFDSYHAPAVYGDYYGVQAINKKNIGFDFSVIATGKQKKLTNNATAYSNTKGDLVIISQEPLTSQISVTVSGVLKNIHLEKLKQAEINDEFWYYASIDKGHVSEISL